MAQLVCATGQSWDSVAWGMDWHRVQALCRYWERHPPLHLMVQGYLGIKSKDQSHASHDDLISVLQQFPQGQ